MKRRWWKYVSALIAAACGLAFGWVAGIGVARAEAGHTATAQVVVCVRAPFCADQPCAENHSSRRFQPSAASSLRKLGR